MGQSQKQGRGRELAIRKAVMFHQCFANRGMSAWMICHCVALAHLSAQVFAGKQKTDPEVGFFRFGGEGGIRTLDTLPYTHFPGVLLQPLGHLTKFWSVV